MNLPLDLQTPWRCRLRTAGRIQRPQQRAPPVIRLTLNVVRVPHIGERDGECGDEHYESYVSRFYIRFNSQRIPAVRHPAEMAVRKMSYPQASAKLRLRQEFPSSLGRRAEPGSALRRVASRARNPKCQRPRERSLELCFSTLDHSTVRHTTVRIPPVASPLAGGLACSN